MKDRKKLNKKVASSASRGARSLVTMPVGSSLNRVDPSRTRDIREAASKVIKAGYSKLRVSITRFIEVMDGLSLRDLGNRPLRISDYIANSFHYPTAPITTNKVDSGSGHWVTLENEQHVYIGGDGKMYFQGPSGPAFEPKGSGKDVGTKSNRPPAITGVSKEPPSGVHDVHAQVAEATKQDITKTQEKDNAAASSSATDGSGTATVEPGPTGDESVVVQPQADSGQVAGDASGPSSTGTGKEGDTTGQPASGGATEGVPAGGKSADPQRVPASVSEVNRRLDRFDKLFRNAGQHQVADWLGKIRDHVNAVGTDASLAALGPGSISQDGNAATSGSGVGKAGAETVQYWGVGTEEANWKNMGQFIEAYLNRNGISVVTSDTSSPDSPLISALGAPDRYIASQGDFKPSEMHFKDKLTESKALPGLETSEDIGTIMGKPVTHLTPEVTDALDKKYGQGQWIVKSYGDEAAAGYGIFFPQRAAVIGQQARDTIWNAGAALSNYGFSLARKPDTGEITGLVHKTGDTYAFGSEEYNNTINGDARHWAEQAKAASDNEKGAKLPEGSFMAQPAFKAVGISDADRAAGKTWHEKNEGRVHLQTKPDGSVEVIPHSTWLKGGQLPVVFEDDDTRAMAAAAKSAIEQIPHEARKGQVYAPDVLKNADGGYSVVELNAQGDNNGSGYLHDNHFTIDAYTSHITGREPLHVSFIKKLLTTKAKDGTPTGNALALVLNTLYPGLLTNTDVDHRQRASDGRFGHQAGSHTSKTEVATPAVKAPLAKVTLTGPAGINSSPGGQAGKAPTPASSEQENTAKGDAAATKSMGLFKKSLSALGNNPVGKWAGKALAWVKEKTVQFYQLLETRYGRKQAIAVFASGQVFSWSATGVGLMMGIPLVIPGMSVVASIPAMALAEVYYQVKGKKDKASASSLSDKAGSTPPPTGNAKDVQKVKTNRDKVDLKQAATLAGHLCEAVAKQLVTFSKQEAMPGSEQHRDEGDAALKEQESKDKLTSEPATTNTLVTNDDELSSGKIKRFRSWLRAQMGTDLAGDALIQSYIDQGYRRGQVRTFNDLTRKSNVPSPSLKKGDKPKTTPSLTPIFPPGNVYGVAATRHRQTREATVAKVKLLAARTFSELEDVNTKMATKMTRVLVDGLVSGKTARAIAREMVLEVDIETDRAMMIVRTELVRAHAEGQLDAMESSLGDKGRVVASVEWKTAQDGKVCDLCKPLEGVLLSIKAARGMIPRHPNCRCAWIPVSEDWTPRTTVIKNVSSVTVNVSATFIPEYGAPYPEGWLEAQLDGFTPMSPVGPDTLAFSKWLTANGANCGIGTGGFQSGNTCARSDGHDVEDQSTSKFIGEKVGKAEHNAANAIEHEIAEAVGGKVVSIEDGVYAPRDVIIGRNHSIEVKSLLKGSKNNISVHEDALLRKVEYMTEMPANHKYHTIVVDNRGQYEDGKHSSKYSGHRMYYRRGNGRYSLASMHPVNSPTELRRLIRADDAELPAKAKGSLPTDPEAIAKLREAAAKAHTARLAKDRKRKAKLRDEKIARLAGSDGE